MHMNNIHVYACICVGLMKSVRHISKADSDNGIPTFHYWVLGQSATNQPTGLPRQPRDCNPEQGNATQCNWPDMQGNLIVWSMVIVRVPHFALT